MRLFKKMAVGGSRHEIGILFDGLDPGRLVGCSLHDGDTDATLHSRANVYCIAVRSADSRQIDYVRKVLGARTDTALLPPGHRFLDGDVTGREPLVPAGVVDQAGNLVVPPDEMVQEEWGDGTAWTVVVDGSSAPD